MSRSEYIHTLAERYAQGDSAAMNKILECAMTDDEACFILDLSEFRPAGQPWKRSGRRNSSRRPGSARRRS